MPSGADGFYYFSVFLTINPERNGFFDVEINGELVCTVLGDQDESSADYGSASCSGVVEAAEGKQFFKKVQSFFWLIIFGRNKSKSFLSGH